VRPAGDGLRYRRPGHSVSDRDSAVEAASGARVTVEEAVVGAVDDGGESSVSMQDQVDQEHALAEWLREVADADVTSGASPAVRQRLLEEVRARRRSRRSAAIKMYALAAGLVIATALPVWQLTTRPSLERSTRVVTICFFDGFASSAPKIAQLSLSVPQDVKIIS